MKHKSMKIALAACLAAAALAVSAGEGPQLKAGDRLAILGDSITEIRGYTLQLQTYVELCSGLKDVKAFSFGWGGDRALGAAARLENDVLPWRPTLMTVCYGMNDGEYSEYNEANVKKYRDGLSSIAEQLKAKGIRCVISSPTCCDPQSFTIKPGGAARAEMYNQTLARMAKDAEAVAAKEGVGFSALNGVMRETMRKAKEKFGENYIVCGDDGVHPGPNGSMLICVAFLKALGLDGQIAKIAMDMKTGKATVSDGHKLLASQPGRIEVESLRYPYCFSPDPAAKTRKHSVESILPFTDFQEKHNRFELQVTGLDAGNYTVAWDGWTKDFASEQLEKGVNLAAEFAENPFSTQFNKYYAGNYSKTSLETWMVKDVISQRRMLAHQNVTDLKNKFDAVADALFAKQAERDAELKKLHVPIKHTITVKKTER